MQIVVNTRMLIDNKLDGIGRFSCEILKRVTKNNPDTHFVFLFDRPFSDEFIFSDNITPILVSPKTRHPILYRYWFQFPVKSILNKMKPDLFFSPDGFLSLGAKCKQLPVIHDINFKHFPKDLKSSYASYYNKYFPKFAKTAARIVTVSEYSKKDIAEHYGIEKNLIDVVYNGITDGFSECSDEIKNETIKKFSKGQPYFLFVGSMHPRKNIPMLMKAFDAFKEESGAPHKLICGGPIFWGAGEIETTFDSLKHNNDIIFTGRIAEEDLQHLYASAFCLAYIPYFEGFGIPLVEAMASGIPIITSDVTSMPEVAGDAALLVNPNEISEIKNALNKIYRDESLREKLIENGRKRKAVFDWDDSARKLWESIEKCLG
ncbi:MAG: glycosyltransferase family 4 protein [Bacteroidia bacterium]|nr:glycosyltransferase family 4 protein [Bacteroidia bacterium]